MKKILVRASILPFDDISVSKAVTEDTIWGNSGNLLFVYGLLRNLNYDEVSVSSYKNVSINDYEWINKDYDMLIIPLANAFRDTWIKSLELWTNLIKKLTIPCIVVGVGMQGGYEPSFKYSYDKATLNFVEAILEKSKTIGVRGELTAEYLKKLGVAEDRIEVIGCPSMYTYGNFIPRKTPHHLNSESRISISYHGSNKIFFDFLDRCKTDFPNYYIIGQEIGELRLLYAGDTFRKTVDSRLIQNVEYQEFKENRLKMFIDVPSWLKWGSEKIDVFVSSRIHGSIAATLAGNPGIIFATDSRVRELATYDKYAGNFHFKTIYLQHGVLHIDMPWKYSPEKILADKIVVSTVQETALYIKNGFREENLLKVGMPRFANKNSIHGKRHKILFAPSWRSYLVGGRHNHTWELLETKFLNSAYFKKICDVLESKELHDLLHKFGYTLEVKLHPIFSGYRKFFPPDTKIFQFIDAVEDESIYDLFITDFSSYLYNFLYQKIPTLTFLPDKVEFCAGMNGYRKLNYSHHYWSGVATEPEELIQQIKLFFETGKFQRIEADFYACDNVCESIYMECVK